MIVGTKAIPLGQLREACSSLSSLVRFAEQLVPKPLRHVSSVVANQKYLVAIVLRDIKSIPYKRRTELCEGLLKGVSVTGVVNVVYDFEDILAEIDADLLYQYLFKEE